MTVPVVWVTYRPGEIIGRGYWDQSQLEGLLDGSVWSTPHRPDVVHLDRFDAVPDGEGAIVVVPARHHAGTVYVDRLNADLARLPWCLVILTGDEESVFPWQQIRHPNMRMWIMSPHQRVHAGFTGRYIGSGWTPPTRDVLAAVVPERGQPRDFFFSGQVTHPRREECAAILNRLDLDIGSVFATAGFTQGMPQEDYLQRLASAKVAPAPSGPVSPDSFRFFEALEAGCIPVADSHASTGDSYGFWSRLFGTAPGHPLPFPVVGEWAQFAELLPGLLAGWPANANRIGAWWENYKRDLAWALWDDVSSLTTLGVEDVVTLLIPTSPIPSHPSTHIIEETIVSIREQLPTAEILVMVDGVRDELADRKADYDEYVRRLIWLCRHRWSNVLPVVFDEHQHQANMTRLTLEAQVRTPLVLFVEHDTPIVGDIDWPGLCAGVLSGEADVIRLHHESRILDDHRHLMVDEDTVEMGPARVPAMRTAQWSQRPHVASADWYRRTLDEHFPTTGRTMIEDRLYTFVATPWLERNEWGTHKVWIYTPPGNIQRSTHTDGREGDDKFEMRFE